MTERGMNSTWSLIWKYHEMIRGLSSRLKSRMSCPLTHTWEKRVSHHHTITLSHFTLSYSHNHTITLPHSHHHTATPHTITLTVTPSHYHTHCHTITLPHSLSHHHTTILTSSHITNTVRHIVISLLRHTIVYWGLQQLLYITVVNDLTSTYTSLLPHSKHATATKLNSQQMCKLLRNALFCHQSYNTPREGNRRSVSVTITTTYLRITMTTVFVAENTTVCTSVLTLSCRVNTTTNGHSAWLRI